VDKLIINAALTGIVPGKADNAHVPIAPEEIAADVRRCRDAGASIVHLHARDETGQATWRKDIYRRILQAARDACPDIVLCVSTSGRIFRRFDERSAVLDLTDPAPEMASLTLGSFNFPNCASVNEPSMIEALARKMYERGIVPEWECFEIGMVEYSHFLIRKGVLVPPYYCNILLGSRGALSAAPFNLAAAVRALPEGTVWAAAGIGRFQFRVNTMAIAMGGHVRVGLEDNIWFDDARTDPATNPRLVERLARIGRAVGREPATPDETRAIIGLRQLRTPVGKATPAPGLAERSTPS